MRTQVAVGILVDRHLRLLVQQRREGTACAGQWEFPGGKIEMGESPEQALKRELLEELGIHIGEPRWLMKLEHDYDHANVSLHTYLVDAWQGEPTGIEGQVIHWDTPVALQAFDLLEAAWPLLDGARSFLKLQP